VLNTCAGHAKSNLLSTNLSLSVDNHETYIAQVLDLNIFQPPNPSIPVSLELGDDRSQDNDADCPSLIFYIARSSPIPDSKDFSLDYTALSCTQVMEEIQVNTTLLYPSMEIAPQSPPSVLGEVAPDVVYSDNNGIIKTWQIGFQIEEWQDKISNMSMIKDVDIGRYYEMIVDGSKYSPPTPLDEMIGEANIDVFANATQHVYGMYMAQALSEMKQDLATPSIIQAHIEVKAEWRVRQHKASKIALQIILGIMTVCGLLTWLCMDTEKVLPHNPCTIAGMASLFADSSLWDDGVSKEGYHQDCSAVDLFGDCAVSMGWHDKVVGDSEYSIENVSESWFGIDRMPQQQHD
jgi:hypothetical protein